MVVSLMVATLVLVGSLVWEGFDKVRVHQAWQNAYERVQRQDAEMARLRVVIEAQDDLLSNQKDWIDSLEYLIEAWQGFGREWSITVVPRYPCPWSLAAT